MNMEEEVLLKLKSTFLGVEFATHILNVIDEVEYINKKGVDNDIDIRLCVSNNKLYHYYIYTLSITLSIGITIDVYQHTEIIIEGDVLDEVLNDAKGHLIALYKFSGELLKIMGVLN